MAIRPQSLRRPALRLQFFADVISELKKVTWPSKEEARRLTTMVIMFSVAVGLILGLVDVGFSRLVESVFVGG